MTRPTDTCARCGNPASAEAHHDAGKKMDWHPYEPPHSKPDRMLLKQVLAQYIADGQIVPARDTVIVQEDAQGV